MPLLQKNLQPKGRIVRGGAALALAAGAAALWTQSRPASLVLAVSAAFTGFEAVRGWCALRACGIKTRF